MNQLTKVLLLVTLIKLVKSNAVDYESDEYVPNNVKSSDNGEWQVVKREIVTYSFCSGGFEAKSNAVSECRSDAYGKSRQAHESDCMFPFYYNNKWHDGCTNDGKDTYWCSLDRVYSNKWAKCQEACPLLAKKLMSTNDPNNTHTSCLTIPNFNFISHFPNNDDINYILQYHNKLKSDVPLPTANGLKLPYASNMRPMLYDIGLARNAQRWVDYLASKNSFTHDCPACRKLLNNDSTSVGQNLFLLKGAIVKYDPTQLDKFWERPILNSWGKEKSNLKYGESMPSLTGNLDDIGHYTAIVNAEATRVGCGVSEYKTDNVTIILIACNYASTQYTNTLIRPYNNGTSCSECSGSCINNLCDCKKNCQNFGKLDLKTCTCQCKPYTTGLECEQKLCDKTDVGYNCYDPDKPSYCIYANVKYDCPHMCGFCSFTY